LTAVILSGFSVEGPGFRVQGLEAYLDVERAKLLVETPDLTLDCLFHQRLAVVKGSKGQDPPPVPPPGLGAICCGCLSKDAAFSRNVWRKRRRDAGKEGGGKGFLFDGREDSGGFQVERMMTHRHGRRGDPFILPRSGRGAVKHATSPAVGERGGRGEGGGEARR